MAAGVTFEAIRKSDYVPFASFYLGGNGTAKAIGQGSKPVLSVGEFEIVSLGDWKEAIDYLIEISDSFYSGNHMNDAISLVNRHQDQMAYFIRIA